MSLGDPLAMSEGGRPYPVRAVRITCADGTGDPLSSLSEASAENAAALTQMITNQKAIIDVLGAILKALNDNNAAQATRDAAITTELVGIRARLNAGIKTQASTINLGIL